jgi:hypothetical protein
LRLKTHNRGSTLFLQILPNAEPMQTESKTVQGTLCRAIEWQSDPSQHSKPDSIDLAQALRQTERTEKRLLPSDAYAQLLGTWRLVFVSKAKKASGQWIPAWIEIQITYAQDSTIPLKPLIAQSPSIVGRVYNQVKLGVLKLTLSGPTAFNPTNGILAFDFTRFTLEVAEHALLSAAMRGGSKREAEFYDLPLKQQAFFRFFWITPQGIAARGRGGGLALWSKK